MSNSRKHFYEFGPFRLYPAERRLRRGGEVLPLTPKAFEVLLLLVRSGGGALSKDDFFEKVWEGEFVEEKNLSEQVSQLRRALGDRKPYSFIETVTGHGYRFAAEVREVEEEGADVLLAERERGRLVIEGEDAAARPGEAPAPREVERRPAAPALPPHRGKVWLRAAALAAVVAGLAAASYIFVSRSGAGRTAAGAQQFRSLAVLPLKPLGGVPAGDDAYLGPGLADALITKLSNVRQVAVRPTSAVLKYAGPQSDLAAVAREQQVDAVLDGSFQRAGDRVRVTVQLVRAADGAPLWAETFDEKFTDIFSVQDAIARRVVGALSLRLSGEEGARLTKRDTENTEAYRLYLLGRYFWSKRNPQLFGRAIGYYQQAVAADPNFAFAHAGLAETYVILPNWTHADPKESFDLSEQEAKRALELDPRLAEAYTALASVKIYRDRDWAGAGEDYRRALDLSPNYATAHQWYGEWLMMTGRLEEALAEVATAQRLDPLSPIIAFEYGTMLYWARRPDEAVGQLRRALELEPGLYRVRVFLSRIHFDRGEYEQAIRERALTFAKGDEERARRIETDFLAAYRAGGPEGYLRRALALRHDPTVAPEHRLGTWVESCARLGDKDCTFEALGEAERARHPIVDSLPLDPYFDFLRDDPRYAELLRRINLSP